MRKPAFIFHLLILTGVSTGDEVWEIGQSAFLGCLRLTQVNIPGSVKMIGENAFSSNVLLRK